MVGYPTGGKGSRIYDPEIHIVKLCNLVDDSNFPSAPCVSDHEVPKNTSKEWFAWLTVVTTEKQADLPSEDATEPEGETGITKPISFTKSLNRPCQVKSVLCSVGARG